MNLQGKVALVTGAGIRVGRALAVALGREKMRVAVHYHSSRSEADETIRLIDEAGGEGKAFQSDLSQPDSPRMLIDEVTKALGGLHVLVNSAALMLRQPFGEVTPQDWDRTMSLNLRAPFFLSQYAAGAMKDGGVIVNVSDLAAFETWPSYIPHSISKSGVIRMTETLARVVAPSIRINAIAPGAVLLPDDWNEQSGERMTETTPLRRLGDPNDVVEAMLYLLHADYVTGETIVVDGGRRVRK